MTLQQRYGRYLEALGYRKVVPSPGMTRRYVMYSKSNGSDVYFLGKSGAVRYSETGTVTDSHSLVFSESSPFKRRMLQWEKHNEL